MTSTPSLGEPDYPGLAIFYALSPRERWELRRAIALTCRSNGPYSRLLDVCLAFFVPGHHNELHYSYQVVKGHVSASVVVPRHLEEPVRVIEEFLAALQELKFIVIHENGRVSTGPQWS